MKAIIIFSTVLFSVLSLSAQIKMGTNGYVKIGSTATPTKTLDVVGSVKILPGDATYGSLIIDNTGYYGTPALYPSSQYSGNLGLSSKAFREIWGYSIVSLSDKRQKENIKNLNSANALNLILKLQGVSYDLKMECLLSDSVVLNSKKKEQFEKGRKNKIGFIAQDVAKIIPEVVVHDDSTDIYGICYDKIVPLLVEAIKLQQSQIDSLKKVISSNKNKTVSSKSEAIENSSKRETNISSTVETKSALISQNIPNPFDQLTQIDYFLPENTNSAFIYIYNMDGIQIKSIPINIFGNSYITIYGSELKAGMYMYTLIADGKVIGTKRMILTD